MKAEAIEGRRAIEALRAGVPSRTAVRRLGTTQEAAEQRFEEALEAVRAGQGVTPIVVEAGFGAGKSHLLEYLQAQAAQERFVTSFLCVSPETPMGNASKVLASLTESAEAPGHTGKALRALAAHLPARAEALADVRRWAEEDALEERFAALLCLFQEVTHDEDLRQQILDDFEGKSLKISDIRRQLKELGKQRQFDLQRAAEAKLAHSRLRLYARLCRAFTGTGLIVFFDELERLVRFTRRQRFAAYQEIGWWASLAAQPGSGILPVFAMTYGLVEEAIVGGRQDKQHFAAMAELEPDAKALGTAGLKLLERAPLRLKPPSEEQLASIRYRVRELYSEAYGAAPSDTGPDPANVDTVRARIRTWITKWDLERFYPGEASAVEAGDIVFDTHEIPDDVIADGSAADNGE